MLYSEPEVSQFVDAIRKRKASIIRKTKRQSKQREHALLRLRRVLTH